MHELPDQTAIPVSFKLPLSVSKPTFPEGGTSVLNQISPPLYPAQSGFNPEPINPMLSLIRHSPVSIAMAVQALLPGTVIPEQLPDGNDMLPV